MTNVNGVCPACRGPALLVFGDRDADGAASGPARLVTVACRDDACGRSIDVSGPRMAASR